MMIISSLTNQVNKKYKRRKKMYKWKLEQIARHK